MTLSLVPCARSRGIFLALAAAFTVFAVSPAIAQKPHPRPHAHPRDPRSNQPVPSAFHPQTSGPGPSSSLNTATWTALGPAPLQLQGSPVSGRVTGIAVDPTNASTIYLATAGGGVWKTTDGGNNWVPLTDQQPTLAIGAIALAPSNHLKIYAGTGEANNSQDSQYGRGILTSSDGGATWSLANANGAFVRNAVAQISVDPANANVAYAAVGGYPQNGPSNTNTGIWKTTDGGTTWTNVTAAASLTSLQPWSSVVIDPNTPSIVYAAVGDAPNSSNTNGVFRSTDAGTTWEQLTNAPDGATDLTLGRIALAVAPNANQADKHVLYVLAADTTAPEVHYFGRSDDADAATPTFTDLTAGTPNFLGQQGSYDIAINVDSNGLVYCSGVQDYQNNGANLVIASEDLGVTWTDISVINNFEPHTDSHAIAFDSSDKMFLGSDGGIYRLDPDNPGWTILNGNLNTIQFQGIGLHSTSINTVVGGSQDNGTELYSDSLLWNEIAGGGDGGETLFSPTDPTHCYAIHPIESFGVADFFQRSDTSCSAGSFVSKTAGLLGGNRNFYPPFTIDPVDGTHVLLGMDVVNETTDAGDTWSPIGTPGSNGFNPSGLAVDSMAISPKNGNNPQVIYASVGGYFALGSKLYVTTDHGQNWTLAALPACTQNGSTAVGCRINQIITDPNDPTGKTAFAVFGNFSATGSSHVIQTTDMGAHWTDITGNLPNLPTWSVQVDTDPSHTMYVSMDAGVYISPWPYATWTLYGAGLPNAQGLDLELSRSLNVLAVATHGRGAWEILTPPHVTGVNATVANGDYVPGAVIPIDVIFSTPVTVTGTPQLTLNTTPNAVVDYSSGSGTDVLTFTYTVASGQVTAGSATGGNLDYASTSALALNGGAIVDDHNVPAWLTLYAPGAAGSISATKHVVVKATDAPKVTVLPDQSTVTTVQTLSVRVFVAEHGGDPVPTGSVVLSGGGFTSAATTLSNGQATILIPASKMAVGLVSLTAAYTPDPASSSIYEPATSLDGAQVPVTKGTPTVNVAPGSNTVTTVQTLSVAVTLDSGAGNSAPTGSVVLTGGAYTSAATPLTDGIATINIPGGQLAAGSVTLSAAYTPDTASASIYTGATGTAANPVTVTKVTPTIVLASSQNPSQTAQSVTFTATVSSSGGTPTGSVSFLDGTTLLGSGTITAGVATYSTSTLAEGSHSITAQYSGDAVFTPVTSAALTQTVSALSIGLAPGTSSTATTGTGGVVDFPLMVTPPSTTPVTMSSTGLPSGFIVTILPPTVDAGAGPTKVDVIIHVPGATASTSTPAKPGSPVLPVAIGLVLLPLLGLHRSIRRGRRFLLVLILAIAGAIASAGVSGCSHNTASKTGGPTVSPGLYTFTVTATAGAEAKSTNLTLNIIN